MSASQNLKVTRKNVATRTITAAGVGFAYRRARDSSGASPHNASASSSDGDSTSPGVPVALVAKAIDS